RERASGELEKMGEPGGPALRKALEGEPSTEARRRIEEVLKKTDNIAPRGELLRSLRAIGVLELIGTAEAKAGVQDLAKGAAGAGVTGAAREELNGSKHKHVRLGD